MWEYDKRRANGAQFVYFGMRLYQSADGAREAEMTAYVHKVSTVCGQGDDSFIVIVVINIVIIAPCRRPWPLLVAVRESQALQKEKRHSLLTRPGQSQLSRNTTHPLRRRRPPPSPWIGR